MGKSKMRLRRSSVTLSVLGGLKEVQLAPGISRYFNGHCPSVPKIPSDESLTLYPQGVTNTSLLTAAIPKSTLSSPFVLESSITPQTHSGDYINFLTEFSISEFKINNTCPLNALTCLTARKVAFFPFPAPDFRSCQRMLAMLRLSQSPYPWLDAPSSALPLPHYSHVQLKRWGQRFGDYQPSTKQGDGFLKVNSSRRNCCWVPLALLWRGTRTTYPEDHWKFNFEISFSSENFVGFCFSGINARLQLFLPLQKLLWQRKKPFQLS